MKDFSNLGVFVCRMRDERILLSTDGPDANVLKMKPPMVFTKENVDEVVSTLDRILKEVRNNTELLASISTTIPKATKVSEILPSKEPRAIKKPIKENGIKSI